MDNKERYEYYLDNFKKVWKDRLTWKGLYGDMPKYSTNIAKYLGSLSDEFWEKLSSVKNVTKFRYIIEKQTSDYIAWVKQIEPTYSGAEDEDMKNFFLGCFGELFFICLLTNINSIVINEQMYHFTNVAPLTQDPDFGVDGTCTYSVGSKEVECAIQSKFWNPFAGTTLTMKTTQGVFSQAVVDGIIDPAENKNILFCWLSSDNEVSSYLKANKSFYKKLVFIDMPVLNKTINHQVPFFWRETLPTFIKSIAY